MEGGEREKKKEARSDRRGYGIAGWNRVGPPPARMRTALSSLD